MFAQKQIRDYTIRDKIGVGSYGTVYKASKKGDKQFYVIKVITLFNLSDKEKEDTENEAKILSSINSAYVVKYYESFIEDTDLYIIMEYCDGGDLSKFLSLAVKTGRNIPEEKVWKFFIQICIGIASIHNNKILHRDIKPLNMFLTKDDRVKIGDLGVAKALYNTNHANTFIGTPYYLSPEICEEKSYNDKSDVWALGCILYELLSYKHPFNAVNQPALILKILGAKYEPVSKEYSIEIRKILDTLLIKNANKRPSIFDIISSSTKEIGLYDDIVKELNIHNFQLRQSVGSNKQQKTNDKKIKLSENSGIVKPRPIKSAVPTKKYNAGKGIDSKDLKKLFIKNNNQSKSKLNDDLVKSNSSLSGLLREKDDSPMANNIMNDFLNMNQNLLVTRDLGLFETVSKDKKNSASKNSSINAILNVSKKVQNQSSKNIKNLYPVLEKKSKSTVCLLDSTKKKDTNKNLQEITPLFETYNKEDNDFKVIEDAHRSFVKMKTSMTHLNENIKRKEFNNSTDSINRQMNESQNSELDEEDEVVNTININDREEKEEKEFDELILDSPTRHKQADIELDNKEYWEKLREENKNKLISIIGRDIFDNLYNFYVDVTKNKSELQNEELLMLKEELAKHYPANNTECDEYLVKFITFDTLVDRVEYRMLESSI